MLYFRCQMTRNFTLLAVFVIVAATVAGFINGCGSVGAIAQGALVAGVSNAFGWQAVFQALMLLAALSSLALGAVWRLQHRARG